MLSFCPKILFCRYIWMQVMRKVSLHNFNKQIFWYFTNSFTVSLRLPNGSVMANTQIKHSLVKEKPVFRWSSSRDSNLNSLPPLGFFGLSIYTSLNATSSVEEKVHIWELSWEDNSINSCSRQMRPADFLVSNPPAGGLMRPHVFSFEPLLSPCSPSSLIISLRCKAYSVCCFWLR